jgi:hypothetical protein
MDQADAWCMVRRRAVAAGVMASIGNHSFRATGITAYLANGGTLECSFRLKPAGSSETKPATVPI